MGASTALYYMHRTKDPSVKLLVLDSPYDDLEAIAKKNGKIMTSLPNFLVSLGLAVVNMGIKNKTNMDLSKLKPIKFIDKIEIPAFFITG